jgi:hypothetical protein
MSAVEHESGTGEVLQVEACRRDDRSAVIAFAAPWPAPITIATRSCIGNRDSDFDRLPDARQVV